MLLQLNIHPSRDADLLTRRTRSLRIRRSRDAAPISIISAIESRASRCRQVSSPSPIASSFHNSGKPDETPPDAPDDADRRSSRRDAGVPDLEPLLRQRQTHQLRMVACSVRNCPAARGRVRAICGFRSRENPLQLSRRALRTAAASNSMHEGIGVCRDFAHLAVALCRCMNIPARYCTGYLGDIGVPPDVNPDGFQRAGARSSSTAGGRRSTPATITPASAAIFMATRPRRGRRRHVDRVRRRQSQAL